MTEREAVTGAQMLLRTVELSARLGVPSPAVAVEETASGRGDAWLDDRKGAMPLVVFCPHALRYPEPALDFVIAQAILSLKLGVARRIRRWTFALGFVSVIAALLLLDLLSLGRNESLLVYLLTVVGLWYFLGTVAQPVMARFAQRRLDRQLVDFLGAELVGSALTYFAQHPDNAETGRRRLPDRLVLSPRQRLEALTR